MHPERVKRHFFKTFGQLEFHTPHLVLHLLDPRGNLRRQRMKRHLRERGKELAQRAIDAESIAAFSEMAVQNQGRIP